MSTIEEKDKTLGRWRLVLGRYAEKQLNQSLDETGDG